MQLNFLSCSFLSTDTLSTLFCSCGPSVLRSLSSLIYLIPHSFEAPLTRSRLLWCVSSKRARSHPVHYQQLEGRHAFLDPNTSSRLPHWLPLSSLGPRSTIRFADPRFCRFSTCPPSRRRPAQNRRERSLSPVQMERSTGVIPVCTGPVTKEGRFREEFTTANRRRH